MGAESQQEGERLDLFDALTHLLSREATSNSQELSQPLRVILEALNIAERLRKKRDRADKMPYTLS